MSNKITVVLVDDHTLVRNGIKSTLEDDTDIDVIAEASDGKEAVELLDKINPAVVVMDIAMPEMNGLEAVAELRKRGNNVPCLILSMHENADYVLGSVESGAQGYILKDASREEFTKAIKIVASGDKYFSADISYILATGYLKKSTGETDQVKGSGENDLTKREKDVLEQIVKGKNNREIAEDFGKSIRTIEVHRSNIMKKLKVKNAVELVRVAMEEKLV